MRRLAMLIASSCAACSLIVDLTNLGGASDSAPDTAEAGPAYVFSDDFNRADSSTIGNGWIAKTPAFDIASGHALRVNQSAADYRDLIVYRNASEAHLDVQASVEVVLSGIDGGSGSWEQLHVRVQPSSVTLSDSLEDYAMFAHNGGTTLIDIARDHLKAPYVVLGSFQLAEAMAAGLTYRFTLRTTGAGPVSIYGSIERYDAPNWTLLGSTLVQDLDSANAIVTPGVVGFSASNGDPTGAYTYDNFMASGN